MPFSLLVAARAHRQPRQALFYPAGMAPSTPEHRQGQASGPDRAAKCSCCAHHFSVHLGAPRQRLLSGAHGAVCLVFFISVLFLDITCPAQCACHSHTHTACCFNLFLTELDMTLRGVRFCDRFMRPPANGRISPMILRKTRSNNAISTRPQPQLAKNTTP